MEEYTRKTVNLSFSQSCIKANAKLCQSHQATALHVATLDFILECSSSTSISSVCLSGKRILFVPLVLLFTIRMRSRRHERVYIV